MKKGMKMLMGITEMIHMLNKAMQGKIGNKCAAEHSLLSDKNPRRRVSMDFKTSSLKSRGSKII